ncbi:MAG: transporter [Myxococcales bacterium]|nr:transporter [Myxococcales bacterium]
MVGPLEKAALAVLLLVLMAGMGASLSWGQFRQVARSPRGLLVGLASQFGWMPLIAWAMARALELEPTIALALIVVGCTPGGTTSNLFSYYTRADLALSISMTVVSSVVAVVAMPAILYLYTRSLGLGELTIPFGGIATTLALMLVPLAVGMWVRAKDEARAARLERAGSLSGIAVLLLLIVSGLVRNRELLLTLPLAHVAAAFALGAVGMSLGWLGARGLGLGREQCRAVSFETGIQNSPLAIAVVVASFPAAVAERMLPIPLLYALLVLLTATLATALLRCLDRRS